MKFTKFPFLFSILRFARNFNFPIFRDTHFYNSGYGGALAIRGYLKFDNFVRRKNQVWANWPVGPHRAILSDCTGPVLGPLGQKLDVRRKYLKKYLF